MSLQCEGHCSPSEFLIMNLTSEQLNDLVEKYCDRVVNEMDIKTMEQMIYDLLVDSFSSQSEKEMEDLICSVYDEDYYKELVEEVTVK